MACAFTMMMPEPFGSSFSSQQFVQTPAWNVPEMALRKRAFPSPWSFIPVWNSVRLVNTYFTLLIKVKFRPSKWIQPKIYGLKARNEQLQVKCQCFSAEVDIGVDTMGDRIFPVQSRTVTFDGLGLRSYLTQQSDSSVCDFPKMRFCSQFPRFPCPINACPSSRFIHGISSSHEGRTIIGGDDGKICVRIPGNGGPKVDGIVDVGSPQVGFARHTSTVQRSVFSFSRGIAPIFEMIAQFLDVSVFRFYLNCL